MAPALTKDNLTQSTEGLPSSPPVVTSVENSVVRQPPSLKDVLQSQLLSTGFGISTQATQLTTSLIASPREKGKPLLVSSSSGNNSMNPPVNGMPTPTLSYSTSSTASRPSTVTKTSTSAMGLTPAEPKPSCSSTPDIPPPQPTTLSNGTNGTNYLHKTFIDLGPTETYHSTSFTDLHEVITTSANTSHLIHSSSVVGRTLESSTSAIETKQRELQKRSDRLLRRLRRLQSWQAISHVRQQLSGLRDYHQNTLHIQAKAIDGSDGKSTVLQDKNVKSLSTSALVNLVQSWQSRQGQPSSRSASKSTPEPEPQTKLDEDLCMELDRVGGNLGSNLHHLEEAVDSDATESSSGGESCDDLDYDDWDGKTPRPALPRRAVWVWAQERSRIAAKWTWLQAQVSDLEYRIRQQNDIYRQVRQKKGMVVLGDHPTTTVPQPNDGKTVQASPLNVSQVLSNMDKQAASLTSQLGNVYSPAVSSGGPVNGLKSAATASTSSSSPSSSLSSPLVNSSDTNIDTSCVSARCRPMKPLPRPRKLLRTTGLHGMSRKAARLSTVKCGCYPPRPPCALCGGRYNNNTTLQPYTMPSTEKLALLDPAYHPVLSFSQDVPLALQFESLLKTGEWQHKHPSKASNNKTAELGNNTVRSKAQPKDKPRKYNKQRINKSVSAAMLDRIKSKYEAKQAGAASGVPAQKVANTNGGLKIRKRKGAAAGGFGAGGNATAGSMRKRARLTGGNNRHNNGQQSSLANNGTADMGRSMDNATLTKDMKDAKKRRQENAFDINNIVIPYSYAAASRVEKLQYKEIDTPKWRELGNGQNNKKTAASASASASIASAAAAASSIAPTAAPEQPTSIPAGVKIIPHMDSALLANGYKGPGLLDDDSDVEDLSEKCIAERHARCEAAEKKKFLSCIKAQRRGRGHRSESSSKDNPAAADSAVDNGDDSNLPSASAVIAELNSYGRSRQASVCNSIAEDDEDSQFNSISPWLPRSFPMPQKDFEDMMYTESQARAQAAAVAVQRRRSSAVPSAAASHAEEVVDEEWALNTSQGSSNRLVLKLHKR